MNTITRLRAKRKFQYHASIVHPTWRERYNDYNKVEGSQRELPIEGG
jgi:hypothetical protein